jgi:hypothetical protein
MILHATLAPEVVPCPAHALQRHAVVKEAADNPQRNKLRYILNATDCDQLPPLKYFVDQSNAYQQAHPYIGPGRLVILYRRNTFWSIVSRIVNMLNILYRGELVLHMFEEHERDNAIKWLVADN